MQKSLLLIILLCSVTLNLYSQSSPEIFGFVRLFHKTNLETSQGSFAINNVRTGVKGNINDKVSYRVFVDFARIGILITNSDTLNGNSIITEVTASFSNYLLDAFVNYRASENLSFRLGQGKIAYSNYNLLPATKMPFTYRPLLTLTTPGLRDIGLSLNYNCKIGIPISFTGALLNGNNINDTDNDHTVNYSTRLVLTPMNNVDLALNYYKGNITEIESQFFDASIDYKDNYFWAGAEYSIKEYTVTSKGALFFIVYKFDLPLEYIYAIRPAFRVDYFGGDSVISICEDTRYTFGLTFDLDVKEDTYFRFNYETSNNENLTKYHDRFVVVTSIFL